MTTLQKAAEKIVRECMGVKKGEKVLVISDENKREIAEAITQESKKITETKIIEIDVGKQHGKEPPKEIAEEMKKYDVIIIPTTQSLSHTKARREANKAGARIATLPGITEEMLCRTMEADYRKVSERTNKLSDILDNAGEVEVKTETGTEIKMSVKGRECLRGSGLLHKKEDFSNLPAGEACIAPVEGTTEGVFVVDASFGAEGELDKDIKVTVKKGYAVSIEGGEAAEELRQMLGKFGKEAYNIAELGIGTNDKAVITGNPLEDEKVFGSCHIALGNNKSYGGNIDVPIHLDGIFYKPTIIIDNKLIMDKGELLL